MYEEIVLAFAENDPQFVAFRCTTFIPSAIYVSVILFLAIAKIVLIFGHKTSLYVSHGIVEKDSKDCKVVTLLTLTITILIALARLFLELAKEFGKAD